MKIGFVETVNGTGRWNANVGMRVQKGALVGIQGESVHSRPQRQDQYCRGSIEKKSFIHSFTTLVTGYIQHIHAQ